MLYNIIFIKDGRLMFAVEETLHNAKHFITELNIKDYYIIQGGVMMSEEIIKQA